MIETKRETMKGEWEEREQEGENGKGVGGIRKEASSNEGEWNNGK